MIAVVVSLVLCLIGLSLVMAGAWVWQKRTHNIGWVDVFWTFGAAGAGMALALDWSGGGDGSWARRGIVLLIAGVWALRLGLYVALRVARSPEEDGRYQAIRRDWGDKLQPRLFWFLQLQAVISVALAASIALAANRPARSLDLGDLLGVVIAVVAIGGETLADQQMRAFRRGPANRGKVCDVGLWGWSRHPNYFFEWLSWFAYPAMAISLDGYPQGWWALLAPAVMFWVLRFGTGVPPLEEHMLRSRRQAFEAYQARVSAFIPLPPKASKGLES